MSIERIEEAKNHRFTYRYAQPEDYHFCQDSVIFPMFVAERIRSRAAGDEIGPEFRALDIGCGCGVIGLELAHYLPSIRRFDFLDIQETFRPYFEENLLVTSQSRPSHQEADLGFDREFKFILGNYSDLCGERFREVYDLVVSNPPYFLPGEGKLSPSELKNRCRFFLDGDLTTLVKGIVNCLRPSGEGYVLTKTGAIHGRDALRDIRLALTGRGTAEVIADIRGTSVVRITK